MKLTEIPLRPTSEQLFTGKSILIESITGFISYKNLIKVVCKEETDDRDAIFRYWDQVLPYVAPSQYTVKDSDLLISANALKILVDEFKESSELWKNFANDGFEELLRDLKTFKQKMKNVEVKTENETTPLQKTRKLLHIPQEYTALLDARQANIVQNEKTLAIRQEALEAREAAVLAREKTVNERENFWLEKEKDIVKKVIQFDKDRKELEDQRKHVDDFLGESLKLAEKYTSPSSSSKKRKTPSKVRFQI